MPIVRLAALVALLSALLSAAAALAAPPTVAQLRPDLIQVAEADIGAWSGHIELPGLLLEYTLNVQLDPETGDIRATIDIPMQGVRDAPVMVNMFLRNIINFTFRPEGAPFEAIFEFNRMPPDGKIGEGFITQQGQRFVTKISAPGAPRLAQRMGPARPQLPQPPFPYTQREVTYENASDGTRLAGTLTIPQGPGPHPVALLITGSGPQDRDETIFEHKPFLVIADHLTRRGVAALRVDDRGVGGSTGSTMNSTAEDFAGDVLAGVSFLKAQPEIDAKRIGLIGHSEGATVATITAAKSSDITFIVMLAGPGLPGREVMSMQLDAILRAAGVEDASIRIQLDAQRRVFDHLERDEREEARKQLERLVIEQIGGRGDAVVVNAQIEAQFAQLTSPWFMSFLTLDPRVSLRSVKVPVLAMTGALDLQVPPRENLRQIEKALKDAGNQDVSTMILARLNHLFQTSAIGSPLEYAQIEETFAPKALEAMTEWILDRVRN